MLAKYLGEQEGALAVLTLAISGVFCIEEGNHFSNALFTTAKFERIRAQVSIRHCS